MQLFVVKYSGPFGFIKPWTAVRDSETFSQQFLTPSIIEGIRQKLEVTQILRHKLTYESISSQQEVTHTRAWKRKTRDKAKGITSPHFIRPRSIIERGVMVNPDLYLAFTSIEEAKNAFQQHVCLARNEDVLLPLKLISKMAEDEFDEIPGFELRFEKNDQSFLVGFNRFKDNEPMYGWLSVTEKPLKSQRS